MSFSFFISAQKSAGMVVFIEAAFSRAWVALRAPGMVAATTDGAAVN